MEVQEFYGMCKSRGLESLDEVGKALEEHEFDSGLVNEVVENSRGDLAARLAPSILIGYIAELSDRASKIIDLYIQKAQRAGKLSKSLEVFKKTYKVSFPVFEDRHFQIYKRLGEPRTPYFFGVKIEEGGSLKVVYSKLGGIKTADEFLALILDVAQMK